MSGECINLQIGNYANYTATHFWNAQYSYTDQKEEIDYTRLFHSTEGNSYPRTVIVDLKNNYGHAISRSEESSELTSEMLSETHFQDWHGPLLSYHHTPKLKSPYHQLWESNEEATTPLFSPSELTSWDDFNYPLYHSKSMVPLPSFTIPDAFEEGSSLFMENEWGNNLIETHFRFFVEACDQLTTIQLWGSLDNGFSGLLIESLLLLLDLYPKTTMVSHTFANEVIHRNLAYTTAHLCDFNLPHYSWLSSPHDLYFTSAWPCVGIDTLFHSQFYSTLPSLANLMVPHLQSSCYSPFQPGTKLMSFHRGESLSLTSNEDVPMEQLSTLFPCVPPFPISNISTFKMSLHRPSTLQPLYSFLDQDLRETLAEHVR